MSNTYLGVGVNFGLPGTSITGTGISTGTFQTQTHKKSRDKETIRDASGTETQATLYNPNEEATFEYFITATTGAGAITATTIPDPGTIVTVVNSTDYPAIAGTTWFVWDDPELPATNTKAKMVKLHLKRWTGTNGIAAVST